MIGDRHPHLARAVSEQLVAFPEHAAYLKARFSGETPAGLALAEDLAAMICQVIGGDWARLCADYRWLSGVLLEEELFFRRNGRYRLSSFAEALEQVYGDADYMVRYMNGLLASQLWWRNHTEVFGYFRDRFLSQTPTGASHLEIGSGHGLLLAAAAAVPGISRLEAWDVSATSLGLTGQALAALEVSPARVTFRTADIFAPPHALFDSITFSEVLEHLEDPFGALVKLRGLLKPEGRLFLNAPTNSPAPDHIYLFHTPEEIVSMAREAGFAIEGSLFAPGAGVSLERARRLDLTISVAVIARRQ
ncbi:MAG: hypothetical protein JWM33_850 [Caulobacteraceae bacterium]|nr:hypothetical protein [Caulobacteraceae bacterium]